MKNGYYVSVYTQVDSYFHYHLDSLRHDHNITLWKKDNENIALIHHWELERVTGYKHHRAAFANENDFFEFLSKLLSQYSLKLEDIVHIFGTPGISTTEDYYKSDLGHDFSLHSISHLFSSLFVDSDIFYNCKILGLAYDGASDPVVEKNEHEKFQYIGCYSEKGEIKFFPITSPGWYWMHVTEHFKIAEGTLMALATASNSESLETIFDDTDIVYIFKRSDQKPLKLLVNKIIDCIMAYSSCDAGVKFNYFDDRYSEFENKLSMIMKLINVITSKIINETINFAIERFDIHPEETYLALSGGFALNCPTNTYLMQEYRFKKQLILPSVNDGGQAIGMGLFYFYNNGIKINCKIKSSYYGDWDDSLETIILSKQYEKYIESVHEGLERFSSDIQDEPVIWFGGRAEIGPRALGNRSILADPRFQKSKDLLNIYKQRQWWRPVAPIILNEYLSEWFEDAFESPHMLNNFKVKTEKSAMISAVLHMDDTARVQTLCRDDNPLLYDAIKMFYKETNIPIICNTSLNDRGEPIINKINEVINFALRKKIKYLYINGVRITLKNFEGFMKEKPEKRFDQYFIKKHEKKDWYDEISREEYAVYFINEELKGLDIDIESDRAKIKKIFKKISLMHDYIFE